MPKLIAPDYRYKCEMNCCKGWVTKQPASKSEIKCVGWSNCPASCSLQTAGGNWKRDLQLFFTLTPRANQEVQLWHLRASLGVKKLQHCENAAATVSTSSHLQTGNHTEGRKPSPPLPFTPLLAWPAFSSCQTEEKTEEKKKERQGGAEQRNPPKNEGEEGGNLLKKNWKTLRRLPHWVLFQLLCYVTVQVKMLQVTFYTIWAASPWNVWRISWI